MHNESKRSLQPRLLWYCLAMIITCAVVQSEEIVPVFWCRRIAKHRCVPACSYEPNKSRRIPPHKNIKPCIFRAADLQKYDASPVRFKDVPTVISDQWIKIVARERCNPNYRPALSSLICSEHFAPYEISPTKKLYSTAIPSINIGPYDDAVIVPDDEKSVGKDSDIVCIIENQISTQPIIAEREDDIVCVIENQISTEPQTTDEQDIDIEDQIQWSLVGTSKHFEGLIHAEAPVSKLNLSAPLPQPPITQLTIKEEKESYPDEEVMIIEEETDHGKLEIENESEDRFSHYENEKEFKDQYSEFLKTYDSTKLRNYNQNIYSRRNIIDSDRIRQNLKNSLKAPSKHFATITQPLIPINPTQYVTTITQPKQFATNMQQSTNILTIQPIPLAPQQPVLTPPKQYVTTSQQTIPMTPKQFESTQQQPISVDPKQFITTTRHPMKPINQFELPSQQPIPVQIVKTIPPTPQLMTTPQFATSPEITTQRQGTLVPSNFSISGMQLCSVFVEQNNVKTYYLSNILPQSSKLVTESDPKGEQIVTPHCLTVNDNTPETNFLNKSSQASEAFQPVIVKTENISDF